MPVIFFLLLLIGTFAVAFYFLRPTKTESAVQQRLEDLHLPYKPKRRTKAMIAREAGLDGLAAALLSNPALDPETEALSTMSDETVLSVPAPTFTTQLNLGAPPTQPCEEPMQGRTSAARPRRDLRTSMGSAISARTIDTMSEKPSAIMRLACSRVMMRPVTIVGTSTARATVPVLGTS